MYYYDCSKNNKHCLRDVSCFENSDHALVSCPSLTRTHVLKISLSAMVYWCFWSYQFRKKYMRSSIEILHQNFKFLRDIERLSLCEFHIWLLSNVSHGDYKIWQFTYRWRIWNGWTVMCYDIVNYIHARFYPLFVQFKMISRHFNNRCERSVKHTTHRKISSIPNIFKLHEKKIYKNENNSK